MARNVWNLMSKYDRHWRIFPDNLFRFCEKKESWSVCVTMVFLYYLANVCYRECLRNDGVPVSAIMCSPGTDLSRLTSPGVTAAVSGLHEVEEVAACTVDCPVDCEVSEWTQWSGCTHTCGLGKTTGQKLIMIRMINFHLVHYLILVKYGWYFSHCGCHFLWTVILNT